MAGWHNTGNWDGLPVEELGYILRDLCNALNEREDALGRTLTTFYIADGTQKSEPVLTDFDGMPISGGSATRYIYINIQRIRTGIAALIGKGGAATCENLFVRHSSYIPFTGVEGETYYYLLYRADQAAGTSYGGYWIAADRPQNHDLWDQMRITLNYLTHVVWFPEFNTVGPFRPDYELQEDDGAASVEIAWDDCKAASATTTDPPWNVPWVEWSWKNWGIYDHSTDIANDSDGKLDTSKMVGTLEKGYAVLDWYHTNLDTNVDVTWDEISWTKSFTAVTDDGTTQSDQGTSFPTVGTDTQVTLAIDTSPPANAPWDDTGTTGGSIVARVAVGYTSHHHDTVRAYTDISADITYY